MENTTKAGIGVLVAGFSALIGFVANWVATKQTPTGEAFAAVGSALATAIAAGIGLIKAADGDKK